MQSTAWTWKDATDLYDLGDRTAGSFEDGLDVLAAGFRLVTDAALDQVAGRIGGELACRWCEYTTSGV